MADVNASINDGAQTRRVLRQRGRWRFAIRLNVTASLVLAFALILLINLLASRQYARVDWSARPLFALSPQSKSLLQEIERPVDVWVVLQRGHDLRQDVEQLLREYQLHSRFLQPEFIDPDRNLARTEELARRYEIDETNVIVFRHDGRQHVLAASDLMEYDFSGVRQGLAPARARFRGEAAFSTALYAVTQARSPVVYMVSGHGERRLDNFDPYVGYSQIAKRMTREHVEWRELLLGEARQIPDDAEALIIAGPTRRFAQPELDLLHAYLERSGRMLVLLDSLTHTSMESLLARWGVRVGDDMVIDPARTFTGRELFVTEYGSHPITQRVRGITSVFYSPRSVEPLPRANAVAASEADKPHVTVLAKSSEEGWAENDPTRGPVRFDAGVDRPGPIGVAVAVERGPVPGIDVQIQSTRMVVFGDSAFVSNGGLTGGDEDFFMSALNWLLDREEMMGIAPRDIDAIKLVMDRHASRRLLAWVLAGLPGMVMLVGLMVGWLRRR